MKAVPAGLEVTASMSVVASRATLRWKCVDWLVFVVIPPAESVEAQSRARVRASFWLFKVFPCRGGGSFFLRRG